MPMPPEYVDANEDATFPWTLLPKQVYRWFVKWFGGNYYNEGP